MTFENFEKELREALKSYAEKYNSFSDNYGIEVLCTYDDELSAENIENIMAADDPRETFWDILDDWGILYQEYESGHTHDYIKYELLSKEAQIFWDENEEKVRFWLYDHTFFYYPEEHFNTYQNVNIMLDTGNMGTLTFPVKMKLFDLFDLIEKSKQKKVE